MGDIPTMRIVTLGKTGSGKSSLSNTLFGEKTFRISPSANSETKFCESKTKTINGANIQLVDTPGFFDTDQNSALSEELLKCVVECAPGPHAFLLVLKVEKFTSQEQAIVDLMLKYFSEEALKFTTVVFTHGDDLPEDMKIEEWVKENKALNDLVEKCGGRCHVMDNRYWKNSTDEYRNNRNQIKDLLQTIHKTIQENEGNCYTNDLLLKVQLMKQSEKALIKRASPDIPEDLLNQKANESVITKLKKNWIGVTFGAVLGALVGGIVAGAIAVFLGPPLLVICGVAGLGGVAGGVAGGLLGGCIGELVSEHGEDVIKKLKIAAKMLKCYVENLLESDTELVKLVKYD